MRSWHFNSIRNFAGIGLLATCAMSMESQGQDSKSETKQELGSTLTLEQLRNKTSPDKGGVSKTPQAAESIGYVVSPAAEPIPALKYRLYYSPRQFKPGNASVHLARALLQYHQIPEANRKKWGEFQLEWGDGKEDVDAIGPHLGQFKHVLEELHAMALCEDFQWDLRIRDLKGSAAYMFLLPEVQSARDLARVQYYQAIYQIGKRDFSGAIDTIRDGYRLAELLGTGETLIQQLVGLAMESMMQDALLRAISTPDCPNLYWAMATLPRPLGNLEKSILVELDGVEKFLPVLAEAESSNLDQDGWKYLWKSTLKELNELSGNFPESNQLRFSVGSMMLGTGDDARARLLKFGIDADKLKKMPIEQLMALDALHEIRQVTMEFAKTNLLPTTVSRDWFVRQRERNEAILRERSTFGGLVARLLLPAVDQARSAVTRAEMVHARLMTLEAIRMYAAANNGKLPISLNDLTLAPAIPDPFTNQPFEYSIKEESGQKVMTLTSKVPEHLENFRELKVRIGK